MNSSVNEHSHEAAKPRAEVASGHRCVWSCYYCRLCGAGLSRSSMFPPTQAAAGCIIVYNVLVEQIIEARNSLLSVHTAVLLEPEICAV